jgi:hypothetical protein
MNFMQGTGRSSTAGGVPHVPDRVTFSPSQHHRRGGPNGGARQKSNGTIDFDVGHTTIHWGPSTQAEARAGTSDWGGSAQGDGDQLLDADDAETFACSPVPFDISSLNGVL